MTTMTSREQVLTIVQEIFVRAPIVATFDAVLEQLGPGNETPDGQSLSMVLEPRPGGRWFRDLGGDNGHLWGHVQAIKRPTLVEITGPLFISGAAVNNVQYRLSETDGGTKIAFRHSAYGVLPEELRDGMPRGWDHLLHRIQERAEGRRVAH